MASHSAYAAYKRDNRYLLHWMINTSNNITRRLSARGALDDMSLAINSTGETTVAELVIMSKMIANHHLSPVPTTVYRLLKSVIKARVAAYTFFVETEAESQYPDVEEQNASHKYFIDALEEIFRNLGGENWSEAEAPSDGNEVEAIEQAIFANRFTALQLDGADDAQDQSDDPDAQQTQGKRQPRPRKSKGNKKNKSRKKRPQKSCETENSLDTVPLERYRIIEGSEGNVAEYLMAVYDLLTECTTLRESVQSFWHGVAYKGEHIAVAGAVSNAAIAMIKRTSSELFVDFPGHDSFETIIHIMTRGRGINALRDFPVAIHKDGVKVERETQDVREQLLTYAYLDLLDFIHEFQKTHSGKPTKRMLKQIASWNLHADLQQLSHEERRRWRRSYTINWLYDLVNVFWGFADGLHSTVKTSAWWRGQTKNDDFRFLPVPLYGVNDFAGFVASLARKSYSTDISNKILPHHVFQLQCMVDSMTVSREDSDHCYTVQNGTSWPFESLSALQILFRVCLGKNSASELDFATSPSRFVEANPHGLWDYSPLTCGVGLLEASELAYLAGMAAWTYTPEVRILMHLYNKLVLKCYIKTPIDNFECLLKEFSSDFFAEGQRPTSNFESCLMASVRKLDQDRAGSAGQFSSLRAFCFNGDWLSRADLHINLSRKSMLGYRKKLLTHHLRAADWNVERVLDDDLPIKSTLAFMRLCHNLYHTPNDLSSRNRQLLDRIYAAGITKAEVSGMAALAVGKKSKQDVKREIDKGNCLSNVNYLDIAMQLRRRYCEMGEALRDLKNPVYELHLVARRQSRRAIA